VALIVLSVLAFGLLLFIGGVVLATLAPQMLLVAALLFALLLLAAGVYQTAGPRPRNYRREIRSTDTSVGVFSVIGGSRFPFFYNQKIPTAPLPRRKTARRTTAAGARRAKNRAGV
jgi:hypothetical protein